MFPIYSLLLTLAFVFMLPLFLLRRRKYASGFRERLGNLPCFEHDGRPVVWLHCVSVGETNAARPLVDALLEKFPNHRLVVSTTTRTGQELARTAFKGRADAIFYFPFDWKFSVRRALRNFEPAAVLLMETEIWPRFIREAGRFGAKIAIVNGRLSERSFRRYAKIGRFVQKVLAGVDLALMQDEADARRIAALGIDPSRVKVTGNLKFDVGSEKDESTTNRLRQRFAISPETPLIVAASTHEPEERVVLEAVRNIHADFRLLIAPRHPERFDAVAEIIETSGFSHARRSRPERDGDKIAKVILLDSIGELRAVYPLADLVFVGGSLIPHGGQSVLEPAAAGKAIVTGPHTHNFAAAVTEFLRHDALVQIPEKAHDTGYSAALAETFARLLTDAGRCNVLGDNARRVIENNRGAAAKTVELLKDLIPAGERPVIRAESQVS